jgi:hypothetical protein
MPRRLRIEFEGAIYHVMARGNARQTIVRDDTDRRQLIEGLEHAVIRYGWELPTYVVMGKADSVTNLTRRFQARLKSQPQLLQDVEEILRRATTVAADRRQTTRETPKDERRAGQSKTKNKV